MTGSTYALLRRRLSKSARCRRFSSSWTRWTAARRAASPSDVSYPVSRRFGASCEKKAAISASERSDLLAACRRRYCWGVGLLGQVMGCFLLLALRLLGLAGFSSLRGLWREGRQPMLFVCLAVAGELERW